MDRKEKILRFLVEELLDDDKVTITLDTSLFQGRILDSMNLLSLISFLEEEYSTKIRSSEVNIDNLDTILKIDAFMDRKLQQ